MVLDSLESVENIISKGGSVFETSLKMWSGYVHTGRIIRNWNTQSESDFMRKLFSDSKVFESLSLKPHSLMELISKCYTLSTAAVLLTKQVLMLSNFWRNFQGYKPLLLLSHWTLLVNSIAQRPTLCVPQLIYKIINLWKFRLNRSSESEENNGKTQPCFCMFRRVMTCV